MGLRKYEKCKNTTHKKLLEQECGKVEKLGFWELLGCSAQAVSASDNAQLHTSVQEMKYAEHLMQQCHKNTVMW